LYLHQLALYVLYALEYVSKGVLIPVFQQLLEVFEALLEFIHVGAMIYLRLCQLGFC
jgi:hypothetical protein